MESSEPVILKRDVKAAVVPVGTPVTLLKGEQAYITQSLGGSYTVVVNGNMFRIDGTDADALGVEPANKPGTTTPSGASRTTEQLEKEVWDALRTCYDPEIPVNIVDLGLIYDCRLSPLATTSNFQATVKMTLTAPGCGMGPMLAQDVQNKLLSIEGVDEAEVELVWDPPWNQGMMTEAAKLQLGLYEMRTQADVLTPVAVESPWAKLRDDFPILDQSVHGHPLVYLDNAATTQKPRAVLDALRQYYENDNANVHRGIHELSNRATAGFEAARQRAASFINARSADEIIFTRGTTEGINLVAQSWGAANVGRGDQILLTEMEHHSNIVPWQMLAQRVGAQVRYIPVTGDEGLLDLSRLDEWLGSGVKLLALTHISNTLGTVNPVSEICARARKRGVVTLVDAAQSAGHRPLDVQEIGCDFLAFSGHKMCGPTGIGILYGRGELLEEMPPFQGGGEMILSVGFDKVTFKKAPHKFEAGTPDISGAIGLHSAMDYLDRVGRQRIAQHDRELGAYAYAKLSELRNIRLFGPKVGRAGLVSFLLQDVHAHDVVTFADQRGVALRGGHHCNQPLMGKLGVPSTARASFYFYNTTDEADRLVEVVREIQKFFNP